MKRFIGALATTLVALACGKTPSQETALRRAENTTLSSPVTCTVRVPAGTRWDDDVEAAAAGSVICLEPGAAYPGSGWLETRRGTATQPVTVVSVDAAGNYCPSRARITSVADGQDALLRVGPSQHLVFDCLEVDGSGVPLSAGANVIHVDSGGWRPGDDPGLPHARNIVFRNVYAHHGGNEGDVLKVNHAVAITVEKSELAFPGPRPGCPSGNCWQECLDFVGVESSFIQDNWLRNGGNMLGYVKGGSRDITVRRNVFSQQGSSPIDPAVGIGAWTSTGSMINGGAYEAIDIRFHDNVIMHGRAGALGVYDANNAYIANNLFLDNDGVVVEFRAGNGSAAQSNNVRFVNNLFVDTRGQLPAPYRQSSHGLTGWVHTSNTYWNNGAAIPAAAVPTGSSTALSTETGFSSQNPGVTAPAASAPRATVVSTTRPAAGSTAYDSGEDVSAAPFSVTTDIEGNPRSGTFDRGPHSGSRDGGNPPPGGTVQDQPILPAIDSTKKAALRALLADGAAAGNRANVFAKVGDSITASGSFLFDVGCNDITYGTTAGTTSAELGPTLQAFSTQLSPITGDNGAWCGRLNSFTRQSMASTSGWTVADVLATGGVSCTAPNNTPAKCELATLKPAVAIIMLGTNDLEEVNDVALFKSQLTTLVRQVIQAKVIPVLSTIPPRRDSTTYGSRVAAYNQAILEVATSTDPELQNRVLLLNYWRALQGPDMVAQGMDTDGVHPSVYLGGKAAVFTTEGLRHGYNQRNLTWVQTLEKVKRIVIDNGTPDSGTPPGPAVTSVGFTVSPSTGTVGTQATITATSSGSSSPRYQFKVTPPGGTQATVCAYAASSTCTFTPSVSGTFTVVVEARDAAATTTQATSSQGYTVSTGTGTVPTITNASFNAGSLSPWTFHAAPGASGGNGYGDAAQWCRGGTGSCANISCGSGASGYHGYRQTVGSVTGGTQYTLRVYLKTQETTAARLRVYRADGTLIAEATTGNTGGVWPSAPTALSFTNPAGNTQLIIEHGVSCGGNPSEATADDWSITSP